MTTLCEELEQFDSNSAKRPKVMVADEYKNVKDPAAVRYKGCGNVKGKKINSTRKCSKCKEIGHRKDKCPKKDEEGGPSNANQEKSSTKGKKKTKASDTTDDDDSQETNSIDGSEDGMLYEEPNDDTSNQKREEVLKNWEPKRVAALILYAFLVMFSFQGMYVAVLAPYLDRQKKEAT
ncbi:hypothetical protein LINPERPRIM_LOCUS37533 [Linum perenne]